MFGITYKVNGVEVKSYFDTHRDLLLFVASNRIKDEDLVSVNLGTEEIGGGIDGFTNYVIDKITREKEAEKEAAEKEAVEKEPVHLCEYNIDDKYSLVVSSHEYENTIILGFDSGESISVDSEKRIPIIKNGADVDVHNVAQLDDMRVINVRAKYIHYGDIVVNM